MRKRIERACSRASCNPSLVAIVAMIVVAVLFWQQRSAVAHAAVLTFLGLAALLALAAVFMLTRTILGWRKERQPAQAQEAVPAALVSAEADMPRSVLATLPLPPALSPSEEEKALAAMGLLVGKNGELVASLAPSSTAGPGTPATPTPDAGPEAPPL